MTTDRTPIVYGCADCGVLRHKPHRVTCCHYGTGEYLRTIWTGISSLRVYGPSEDQLRAFRAAVDPVVSGEINGKRFVAPLSSGTQIRKAIKEFTKATQMQLTVAA